MTFDVKEANRIILGWGAGALSISPTDRYMRVKQEPPGCRHPRQDGYACWGEVSLSGGDTCARHADSLYLWIDGAGPAGALAARFLDSKDAGVYLVVGNGLVKIGKARDVVQRYAALRTSSPIDLRLHRFIRTWQNSELEAALHRHFKPARRHGEWFEAIEVLPAIDQLSDQEILAHFLTTRTRQRVTGRVQDLARWASTFDGRRAMSFVPKHVEVVAT